MSRRRTNQTRLRGKGLKSLPDRGVLRTHSSPMAMGLAKENRGGKKKKRQNRKHNGQGACDIRGGFFRGFLQLRRRALLFVVVVYARLIDYTLLNILGRETATTDATETQAGEFGGLKDLDETS